MGGGDLAILLFASICVLLMLGFPVALTLAGTALGFAGLGIILELFDASYFNALPGRIFGTMNNTILVAVPLFIFMGNVLERARVAEELLINMARLFGRRPGGIGVSVIIVGALLAASTGIVGATVVTMALLSLPSMLKAGYRTTLATGTICATGTLGQIIPPSIALVLLGDIMATANQQAQLSGASTTGTVSVGDLFVGALIPGLILVGLYILYVLAVARFKPEAAPPAESEAVSLGALLHGLIPPVLLMSLVLGSILLGAATPTEAAGVGAVCALALAASRGELSIAMVRDAAQSTVRITSMVFTILIGAAVFSLVFRGLGGDVVIEEFFTTMEGGPTAALLLVMLGIFLLGFILDFIEITFVVVPLVGPILIALGFDPIWLAIMIAINLQTSFLTPPFGFALFYLRGVADASVPTGAIYRGVVPFIVIQLGLLFTLWLFPALATWLPKLVAG
ncbi:trap dicarboxylate transporter, dctm subunit [Luminiphilus syltensis NOR5-1B]|uniref:TRAP transporter large permease protein n=1 Tax=Luminiphilus syltensis NOR5-1B TaxID=565045 RepID=B8KUB4_9GAMM|nr:trap dicarboxylate transporter, dctm subunit [Luminiphilus syltensis NOR5-1B]